MKLPKKLPAILLTLFVIVFTVSVAGKLFLSYKNPGNTAEATDMVYTLSPNMNEVEAGEKVSVPVYLSGSEADTVTAFDIKFDYDKTKLSLDSAKPGTFFEKYLTVKWDDKEAWYALAMTPSTPQKNSDPSEPLLTLEFTALTKTDSTSVTTSTSTVYVSKTGGFHPQSGKTELSIQ